MQVLATAVTPVVLISATAIMIGGVNSRYMALADRVRALTHESRAPETTPHRREHIGRQLPIFHKRVQCVSRALSCLYAAIVFLVCVTLFLSATFWREVLAYITVPLFFAGVSLILIALVFELLELRAGNRTLSIEMEEVLPAADFNESGAGVRAAEKVSR